MKLIILAFAFLCLGQSPSQAQSITQYFQGVITSNTYGSSGWATGVFLDSPGTVVRGSFSVDPTKLVLDGASNNGILGGTGYYYTGSATDGIQLSDGTNSYSLLNLFDLGLLNDEQQLVFADLASSTISESEVTILCNTSFPFSNVMPTAFPLFIPAGCSASMVITEGGAQPENVGISITSMSSLPPTPTLLDPTSMVPVDSVQNLMEGSHVTTTDFPRLETQGRPVSGIAADGTAEIVLRIPTTAADDTVTVTVLDDSCGSPTDPSTCSVSSSTSLDGGLIQLSNASDPTQLAPSQPASNDKNKFAFVIYRAPIDFVRLGNSVDQLLSTRSIELKFTYQNSQGVIYGTQYVPLTVVRPPIVLTHGYASSARETWTAAWDDLASVAHTTVYPVDYSSPVQVVSTIPAIACLPNCETLIRESDLGIIYNTPGVATQTLARLRDYATGHNLANAPVAISQFDSVGHSMGGLLERYWSTNKAKKLDGTAVPFNTPDNFGAGYIHKLITLGTPHFGSPFATEAISDGQPGSVKDPGAGCFRTVSALPSKLNSLLNTMVIPPRYEIGIAILDSKGTNIGGAVGDLDGDGIGNRMSVPLNSIKTEAAQIPSFNIAGIAAPAASGAYDLVNAFCGPLQDSVAKRMTIQLYGTLFDPNLNQLTETIAGTSTKNDGAVPLTSALRGAQSPGPGAEYFNGDAHGGGTAILLSWGLGENLVEDSGVVLLVEQLLNTSVADTTKWVVQ